MRVYLIGILIFGLISVPCSSYGATLTVDKLTDENDSSCTDGDCSLRDALDVALSGDTINFSVTGTITLTLGELLIERDVTIGGPGLESLSIDGNSTSRIFYVSNDLTVTVSGLTLTHGRVVDANGGAIENRGALTLDRVLITQCRADHSTLDYTFGGAIYNFGALVITNSTLDGNQAYYSGGAIYSYFEPATLTLTDVILSNNLVSSVNGSGGNLVIRGGPSALTRVEISGGSAPNSGGGLFSDASFTITDSLIYNNSSPGWGAGIDLSSSSPAPTMVISNSTITGNSITTGNQPGAGIYCGLGSSGSLTMNNVTISGNSNTSVNGGAGFYGTNRCHIRNSILADNSSPNSGGSSADCANAFDSLDYNIIGELTNCTIGGTTTHNISGESALLSPLADNGGATLTMALQSGSPALDAGDNSTCASSDQRGAHRPLDGSDSGTETCDIGAYEASQNSATVISGDSPDASDVDSPVSVQAQVSCGSAVATGAIHFSSGSDSCDATLASGTAQCNLTFTSSGSKTITANYNGDLSCNSSSATTSHTVNAVAELTSQATKDGSILEKRDKKGKGGAINSQSAAMVIGDNKLNKQSRGILSFDTSAIPSDATLISAQITLTRQNITAHDPFAALKGLFIDMRSGYFGKKDALESADFSADGATKNITEISNTPSSGVYTVSLPDSALALINRSGATQFRLRFKSASNRNNSAENVTFYTGNASDDNKPTLTLRYRGF